MTVIFGSARIDERGKISGGQAGDQTKNEVSTQNGYIHSKGWDILRASDTDLANGLAFCMAIACSNDNIGYDQSNRDAIIRDTICSTKPTECDCSSLVRACLKQCGVNVANFTTQNAISVIKASGKFTQKAFTTLDELCTGDILCTKTKGHIVIVVQGRERTKLIQRGYNIYPRPAVVVTSKANAKNRGIKNYISVGDGVRYVQYALQKKGYNIGSSGIDGSCGPNTVAAIKQFQKDNGLVVDGLAGPKTLEKLDYPKVY